MLIRRYYDFQLMYANYLFGNPIGFKVQYQAKNTERSGVTNQIHQKWHGSNFKSFNLGMDHNTLRTYFSESRRGSSPEFRCLVFE